MDEECVATGPAGVPPPAPLELVVELVLDVEAELALELELELELVWPGDDGELEHAAATARGPAAMRTMAAERRVERDVCGACEPSRCLRMGYIPIWNVIWLASAEGSCTALISGTQSFSRSGV
jgi:hypothetical protein